MAPTRRPGRSSMSRAGRTAMPSQSLARAALPLAVLMVLSATSRADSGSGVDMELGNALLVRAGGTNETPDARGTSWLRPGQRRSPSGNLYSCPLEPPTLEKIGEWEIDGHVQLGWIGTYGDDGNALWNR